MKGVVIAGRMIDDGVGNVNDDVAVGPGSTSADGATPLAGSEIDQLAGSSQLLSPDAPVQKIVECVVGALKAIRSGTRLLAIGVPMPVVWSYPGMALMVGKPKLAPPAMSLKSVAGK